MKAALTPARWPRLSETLPGPIHPEHCQYCGVFGEEGIEIFRWIEHDQHDEPENIRVILCKPCAARLIEPHPRLYDRLPDYAPCPGNMQICAPCAFRSGTTCTHPSLKANRGAGLEVICARPSHMHVQAMKPGGGRTGFWITRYAYSPRSCAGFQEQPGKAEELLDNKGRAWHDPGHSTELDEAAA